MKKNEEQLLETENPSITTIEQLDEKSLDTITGGQFSSYKINSTTFNEHQTDSTGGGSRTNVHKPSPE